MLSNCFFKITSTISFIDFLADSPKLKVNSCSSYRTFIGGVISLILAILSIIGSFYFGKELFLKENPMAVESIKDFDVITPILWNSDNFEVYTAIEYANYTYYNNPRIFEFRAFEDNLFIMPDGKQNYSSRELEIKTCTK